MRSFFPRTKFWKAGRRVAFKFREKEIIKVCVRKVIQPASFSIGVGVVVDGCNVTIPNNVTGLVTVNGQGFAEIPVSLTVTGQATVFPTTVFTRPDGSFSSTLTPTGPGVITLTATATIDGISFSSSVTINSPCLGTLEAQENKTIVDEEVLLEDNSKIDEKMRLKMEVIERIKEKWKKRKRKEEEKRKRVKKPAKNKLTL